MGIRDKVMGLFSKQKKEAPEVLPRELTPEERSRVFVMTSRISDHIAAPVDVLDENMKLLFSCRLVTFESYELHFERLPGMYSLGLLQPGDKVYLQTYTTDLREISLCCKVRRSTRTELRVGDIKNLSNESGRADFRQPLDVTGEIYESDKTYMNKSKHVDCQIRNISKSGACITSSTEFKDGDTFILRTEIYKGAGPISFHGQVIRVKPTESGFEYGILFEQLSQKKLHDLTIDLEELRSIIAKRTYG